MFQALDDKGECVGIYKDGELHFRDLPIELDATWSYTAFLKGLDVQYANIYTLGKSLEEVCPDHLKNDWSRVNNKLKALINSFIEAKVDLKQNCFFDLTPVRFLKEYCELKNKICEHTFNVHAKPQEYNFFKEFTELTTDIAGRELQLDKVRLSELLYNPQAKKLWEKINNGATSIKYNLFNSVTGRLTVTERSFPILNLSSKLREIIKPTNDWFVSFDLNAAEMRIALALSGENQPEGDLHESCVATVFNNELTRAQAKSVATEWLYDSNSELAKKYDQALSKFYNKRKLFSEYWKDGYVCTPYSRKIEADRHHVISYLNQSTLIDMFHRQLLKINKLLENKKSFIAFTVHDCVVLDLKDEDKKMLPDLIRELSNTPYGTFPVKVEIGHNFGDMKKVKIKI